LGLLVEEDLPASVRAGLGASPGARFDTMVGDVVATSDDADEVGMSAPVLEAMGELRRFLFARVYVQKEQERRAQFVLCQLMEHHLVHPDERPAGFTASDWVAGMTDEYALRDFERVCLPARHGS
jgi:dGTPase